MADKDDFSFDEEESELDSGQESEDWGDYEPEKKGGSKRLIYLLLLLLVLAGGAAAYFFLLAPEDGPSSPVTVVNVPSKPVATPMPKPIGAIKPAESPESQKPAPVPVPADPVQEPVAAKPAAEVPAAEVPVAKMPKAPAPAPVAKPQPTPTDKPAPVAAKPKLFEPETTAQPVMAGDYTLSAGAFLMQSSVDGVVKKIRKLGYQPKVQPIKRKVEMTRLLVGVYSPDVATRKLREVKKITSGAFSLNKGSKTAVYAGSFVVLDKARVFADTSLTNSGIRVTEEPVQIDQTLQRVTFGSFVSRAEADKVSREVAGKGLEAKPVKK